MVSPLDQHQRDASQRQKNRNPSSLVFLKHFFPFSLKLSDFCFVQGVTKSGRFTLPICLRLSVLAF